MALAKKKPVKKIIEKKTATTEDLVLGNETEVVEKIVVCYEAPEVQYRVTNLKVNNNPVVVTGDVIEAFLGAYNKEAREALKGGAKTVIAKDYHKNDEYRIEVL